MLPDAGRDGRSRFADCRAPVLAHGQSWESGSQKAQRPRAAAGCRPGPRLGFFDDLPRAVGPEDFERDLAGMEAEAEEEAAIALGGEAGV